ncbi:MAG: hypothetical protein U1E57_00030 [Paenacidovorax caeni]
MICQTGCASHGAFWRVEEYCKRTARPACWWATRRAAHRACPSCRPVRSRGLHAPGRENHAVGHGLSPNHHARSLNADGTCGVPRAAPAAA